MRPIVACSLVLPAVLAGVVLGPSAAPAQDRIACGADYTVRAGDSLSAIALRAYETFNYQAIFEANRNTLVSPAVLRVGQPLFVPCLDGAGAPIPVAASATETAAAEPPEGRAEVDAVPAAGAEAEAGSDGDTRIAATSGALPVVRQLTIRGDGAAGTRRPAEGLRVAAVPASLELPPADRTIHLLTGSNAPFSHREMPEGGMITELVNRALLRANDRRPYDLAWDNRWDRHLSELLPSGEADLGFPWFRPDCGDLDSLPDAMRPRCTDFDYSDPIYEVVVGYYARPATPAAQIRRFADLGGMRVCRPAGHFTFDLEMRGLVEPGITLVRPRNARDCFAMLAAGEADVVSLNRLIGDGVIASEGIEGVTDLPALSSIETLHMVAARSNPYGRAYLDMVDRGLRQLRQEGVWFEVTSRHMNAYMRRQ